jgi:nucleotide sugar dehydrogenase
MTWPGSGQASPFADPSLPLVCVQGAGFVGCAMGIAVAAARGTDGRPRFNVAVVDLDNARGRERVESLQRGRFPFATTDARLHLAHETAVAARNLAGTTDGSIYAHAAVAIVDVNLDVDTGARSSVDFSGFRAAIVQLADRLPAGALLLVETTVPPGTCERIVVPAVQARLTARGLPPEAILVAHSYERVMPGAAYLDSITNFWRVYAGATPSAADACDAFLSAFIDTKTYPLTRVATMTASEIGKLLENSYRATTIAFMEEWARLAERVGVDLFPVIDAIRLRPTHSNMRQPGFGVGGYCLTKDPLLAGVGAREIFGLTDLTFPFSEMAVHANRHMPLETLRLVREGLGGSIAGRRLLLLGVSYRPDVGDTRSAPAETFVRAARSEGASIDCHDPLVARWEELDLDLETQLPAAAPYSAVIFSSTHDAYVHLDVVRWLNGHRPLLVDSNHVLSGGQIRDIGAAGVPLLSIGRGKAQ